MLNSRSMILLAVALVLALAAVFLAQRWIGSQQQAAVAPPVIETVPVVVAAAQINPLDKIKPDQLKIMEFPKSSVPFDASLPGGGLNFFAKPDEVLGKFATQTVYPNEVIVRQRLRDSQGGSSLSNILSPSMRAVSLRVNEATGVAGFLLSGNHVDILNTQKAADSDNLVTRLVLQNVKVLAVDQDASTDDKGKPILAHTVTVEVRPQDAGKLLRAGEVGTIQMVLRNPRDDILWPESVYASQDAPNPKEVSKPADTPAAPLGVPAKAAKKQGVIRTRTIIRKDGKQEVATFECNKNGCLPLAEKDVQDLRSEGLVGVVPAVKARVDNLGAEMEGEE